MRIVPSGSRSTTCVPWTPRTVPVRTGAGDEEAAGGGVAGAVFQEIEMLA